MIPDLGTYAVEVSAAYVVSLALLAAVVWLYLRRARHVKMDLDAAEDRARVRDE